MRLDGSLRARLRALVARGRSGASDAPAPRSCEAEQGRRDLLVHVLWLSGAAALAALVIARLEADAPTVPRASMARRDPPPLPAASPGPAEVRQPATAGRCADAPSLSFSLGAQRRLDLGSRALLVANHGAVVAATQSADCDLRVGLAEGSLAVHARDMQGRALVVSTSRGEVRARGTVFLVDFYAASGELEVGVEEGEVEFVTTRGRSIVLEPGRAAYLGSHLELEPFDDDTRARLRRMLGLAGKQARASARQSDAAARALQTAAGDPPGRALGLDSNESEKAPTAKKLKRRSEARRRDAEPAPE